MRVFPKIPEPIKFLRGRLKLKGDVLKAIEKAEREAEREALRDIP